MKYIYITTIFLSLFVIGCDRGEDPSYNDLSIDATHIVLNLTKGETSKEIKVLSDNKNYRLDYLNKTDGAQLAKDSAKVQVQKKNGVFTFTGKKRGRVYFKLYDWTNQESLIKVDVQEEVDLVLDRKSILFRPGAKSQEIEIYDGNGGYEFTFNNPAQDIVEVTLAEPEEQDLNANEYQIKGYLTVVPKNIGKTVLIVKDSLGKELTVDIEVRDFAAPLNVIGYDPSKVVMLTSGTTLVIPYEGGEPTYTVTSSSTVNPKVSIDTEAKTITLVATATATSKATVTLRDGSGQSVELMIQMDKSFLDDKTPRVFKLRQRSSISTAVRGGSYITSLNRTVFEVGSAFTTHGITYVGNTKVGAKTAGRLYVIASGQEKEGSSILLSACKLEKVEDNYYWFTFTEKDSGDDGYMVFRGPDTLGTN